LIVLENKNHHWGENPGDTALVAAPLGDRYTNTVAPRDESQ
jgi:hypothetical protein